jgi:hypothetical protein
LRYFYIKGGKAIGMSGGFGLDFGSVFGWIWEDKIILYLWINFGMDGWTDLFWGGYIWITV